MSLRNIFKFRVILLLLVLIIGLLTINPTFDNEGAAIRAVEIESSAAINGIASPDLSKISPTDLEIIKKVNQKNILTPEDYGKVIEDIEVDEVINIQTDRGNYAFLKEENRTVGISVSEVATSNLKKGLDLQGGTRVLLRPETPISDEMRNDVIDIMNNRLNTYGLSDITIREADDLVGGEKFILIEIAGASREEVETLIESQGKFEAKIGNETVFRGSEKDVVYVCKNDGSCSGVSSCQETEGSAYCEFVFTIQLSEDAARRHADMTDKLSINSTSGDSQYLNESLDLYLDDSLVSSLQIGSSLKGVYTDTIQISGPGFGPNAEAALDDAIKEMEKLQTVLITGSLPVKLETVKMDNISPTLGKSFVQNALLAGALAMAAVAFVLLIRYRTLKIVIPSVIIMLSELFLILATAALFKFSLDLAAIAGIIAAVGTGVDDQIVISDEILRGGTAMSIADWKRRVKKAFFIVFVAYATTVAAMVPLFVAGAGLLTGFAFSTIVGVTIGVFITRPAFASIAESFLRKKE
tara:strand:- start:882 stop:2459 length:1578 start_codon:yes stop_codon:yes gene_type:complete